MASISTDDAGRRRILFKMPDGARRQIRLGKIALKKAETVQGHVEEILKALELNMSMRHETVAWIAKAGDKLVKKLAAVGLIEPRQPQGAKSAALAIVAFVDGYIALRTEVKPNTLKTWGQARDLLVEHFGKERTLDKVTALDARGFHSWLSSATTEDGKRRFSPASVSKYTSFARQFFAAAVDAQIIGANPFGKIKLGKRKNDARQRFVSREIIDRVIKGCTDPQFKLVIALSRFGGLRIPSELDGLLWQHIDRDRGRILIHSPKTEHHEGGATREIPLFPELVPYIDARRAANMSSCRTAGPRPRGARA
jgi:hypothetical protein